MRTNSRATRRGARSLLATGLGALLIGAPGLACGDDETSIGPGERLVGSGAIETGDFFFEPSVRRAVVGEQVTWFNSGEQLHTVKGPGFASQAFGGGETYRFRFRRPGTYRYLCTLHPSQMAGKVIVE